MIWIELFKPQKYLSLVTFISIILLSIFSGIFLYYDSFLYYDIDYTGARLSFFEIMPILFAIVFVFLFLVLYLPVCFIASKFRKESLIRVILSDFSLIINRLKQFSFLTKTDSSKPFNFLNKLRYLFFAPHLFFEKVKLEVGIKSALLMYIAASTVFYFYYTTHFVSTYYGFGFDNLIALMVLGILITITFTSLVHVVAIIFKGKGTYADTFKVYSYSMVPLLLLTSLPIVGYLSIIYSCLLIIIGIYKLHNISKVKSALVFLLSIIGAVIIAIIIPIFRVLWYFGSGGYT